MFSLAAPVVQVAACPLKQVEKDTQFGAKYK
jgi:hypothetical protein